MTYQNDNIREAIMEIQRLLRTIQISNKERVTVPIDGIYGETTIEAVRKFQQENGLKETGTVDKKTYDTLYSKSLEAEFEQSEPLPLYVFPKGKSVSKGERSDFVMLLQIILNELTIAYDGYDLLELNGIFDDNTENAIRIFQEKNNINNDGIVKKETWNALVTNYNIYSESQ